MNGRKRVSICELYITVYRYIHCIKISRLSRKTTFQKEEEERLDRPYSDF